MFCKLIHLLFINLEFKQENFGVLYYIYIDYENAYD